MTTHAILKADVSTWLIRDDLDADIATVVRLAEAQINRRLRVRAMETTTTLSCTSRSTSLPSDFVGLRSVSVDSTTSRHLDYMTPETIREANIWSLASGEPQAYTIEGTSIVLAPEPSATGTTLDIVYFAKFAALSEDTDTNWLLTNNYDIYLYACLQQAAILIQDDVLASKYNLILENAITELVDAERKGRLSGSALVANGNPRANV